MTCDDVDSVWIPRAVDACNDVANLDIKQDPTRYTGGLDVVGYVDSHAAVGWSSNGSHLRRNPVSGGANATDWVGLAAQCVPGAEVGKVGDNVLNALRINLGNHGL